MKKHFRSSQIATLLIITFITSLNLSPFTAIAATTSSTIVSGNPSRLATPVSNIDEPAYIYIPSINLLSNVQGVGIDKKGNMDVPSGKTNDVGWYQYGPTPGTTGTAVLDAHNTAAFKNLNRVPVGGEIYIITKSGKWQRFVVNAANVYSMKTLKPQTLFAQANYPKLNLITCAGTLLGGGEATHRLIVSAYLV